MQFQATTSIANVLRNLLTPGVFRILCPSALESLSLGGRSAISESRSVLRILRGTTSTELPHLIWTPDMRIRLIGRLSQVMCATGSRFRYFNYARLS